MTQQQLTNIFFVSDKTISSCEQNRTEANLELLVNLSKILNYSPSYLIYGNIKKTDIETEIKIKFSKIEYQNLIEFMKNNSTILEKTQQLDNYYQPTHRKFLKDRPQNITEWLRIGIRGNKKILNYKNWYDNKYCDEYEVEIDDEENLEKIFKILGLEKIIVVDKTRKSYLYLDKYEIALDYVKDLGYFIEIEVKKYNYSVFKEYDMLLEIAKNIKLNLKKLDKKGYHYHLIYKD